jgi:uncharacterized membrane protein YfcA
MTIYSIIGLASLISGFLSGLVGIGGGIIMAPILIFLPAWVGLPPLTMKVVAGLTIMQGLIGCLMGAIHHKKFNFVSGQLLGHMGVPIFLMSFIGGYLSHFVSNVLLLILFATLALAASILIFIPVKGDSENPDVNQLDFNKYRAVMASAGVGLLGGMVGLAIVTLATSAGFLGKAISGQIEWWFTIPILISTIPATYIGSMVSKEVSFVWLKRILAVLIAVAAVRIWISILWG